MGGELIKAGAHFSHVRNKQAVETIGQSEAINISAAWARVDRWLTETMWHYVEIGRALRDVKRINRGHYIAGLAVRGLSTTTAQRMVDLSTAADGLDADARVRLERLGVSRFYDLKVALHRKGVKNC